MAKISSNWRLRFDPAGADVVLLAYGDMVEGELKFPWARPLETVPLVDAAAPFLRLSKNSKLVLSFAVYKAHASDAAARQAVMESLLAIDALVKKPLRIEISGISDRYWQFANAAVSEHEPAMDVNPARPRTVRSYNITVTGMTQVGP